ncbi:homoserine O-acetyltransferase/O-succinyltransferase family protein [Ligilactobacillus apodemi]|nr:homoserine O-succinyltransferase [Ligilactobacillus apodemi]
MRTPENVLRIGVLNLMHDKLDTKRRFENVLQSDKYQVELTFFYPKDHYQNRVVPKEVAQISRPLDLELVKQMDAFIVTGAPIEKLSFTEITYINELQELFECLERNQLEQLYVCWGAMAAADYFYGVGKKLLPQKIFGIYPQKILRQTPLLKGILSGFLAPHARYADIDLAQVQNVPELKLDAISANGEAFLLEAPAKHQAFLFSHLEYGRQALKKEYEREVDAASVDQKSQVARPENYYVADEPQFSWYLIQKIFFKNWLQQIACNQKERELIKN